MKLCSISLMKQYLHLRHYLGFFHTGDYSFPIIYLVHHLFISVGSNGYLFYTFVYNPVLCYLLCCSNCSNFGYWGAPSVGPVPQTHPITLVFLSTSLLFWSQQTHVIYYLPQPFLQRAWFLFIEEWYQKQRSGHRCAHCTWVLPFLVPLGKQSLEIYLCILTVSQWIY